ncbi:deoxynucleoside triphosphate triphosphohydrolase SAMHD1-like isoform X2 [Ornithodoros turicata]
MSHETDDTSLDWGAAKPAKKVFCDPIHKHITLHPVSVAIIDTPEFQRLRDIKQLALVQYIYPGATHTRFEHCLGTAHLAKLFIKKLKEQQPELNVTEKQVLCLEIAGLCHDLGHGPFSHLWEDIYEAGARARGVQTHWKHERTSSDLLEHLIRKNNLMPVFERWEAEGGMGLTADDIRFVHKLIVGDEDSNGSYHFMFQIINNGDSGLDVDKWDYYLRDSHAVGVPCHFDFLRLVNNARVIEHEGKLHICFRDKEVQNVYEMFRTRCMLHRLVYQHRMEKIIEQMVCDAVLMADEKITGIDGRPVSFWQTTHNIATDPSDENLAAYCLLTDSVVRCHIKFNASSHPDVVKARELWKAFETRSQRPDCLYTLVGRIPCAKNSHLTRESLVKELISEIGGNEVEECDIIARSVSIHWGRQGENPVEKVLFFKKNSNTALSSAMWSNFYKHVLPKEFEDSYWNVILRKSDPTCIRLLRGAVSTLFKQAPH